MIKRLQKRIKLNDAQTIRNLGCYYESGINGLPQNRDKALELWRRAAELGDPTAYFNIGIAYKNGINVKKDEKKAIHCWELAAIGGDSKARHNLGAFEELAGNNHRALKHYIIAVEGGEHISLKKIRGLYTNGHATKEDYAKALRSYQECLDEIKSDQRDEVAATGEYKYYESAF